MIKLISDPHLGHRAIAKYRPWVTSVEHNTNLFVQHWRKEIGKKFIVYMLGDVAFDDASLEVIGNLPGRKILIKGNHDDMVSTKLQADVFEEIHGIITYKKFWLSHAPIHPTEMRNRRGNVHGHTHAGIMEKKTWYGKTIPDPRYINVCVDNLFPKTGRMFMDLDTLKAGCYK